MNKAVAVCATSILVSFVSPVLAQSPNRSLLPQTVSSIKPFGSAAALLDGLQVRSVKDTSLPAPATFNLPGVGGQPQFRSPLGGVEFGGGGLDPKANPSNVFPQIPAEYDSGMKVRYRFEPQQ
jgi:hypothetical protein